MPKDMMTNTYADQEKKMVSQLYAAVTLGGRDATIAAAYVLMKAESNEDICMDTVETYFETASEPMERRVFIQNNIGHIWNNISVFKGKISQEALKTVVLYDESCCGKSGIRTTPDCLAKLAYSLMEIKPGDKVADLCTGQGGVIREFFNREPNASYYGNDIDVDAVTIASIRAELLGGDITIEQKDIFNMEEHFHEFDTVFANYPFGMRAWNKRDAGDDNVSRMVAKNPEFSRTASMDWIINRFVYDTVGGPRRAVCIMTNGSTMNTMDQRARNHFLSMGLVEAVIALPDHLFAGTAVPVTMLVLSHGNLDVMMVDARNMCTIGRRQNVMTDEDVQKIYKACQDETEFSRRVSYEEIKDNGYVLSPDRYQKPDVQLENGKRFGDVIKHITRGAPLKASQLDEMVSGEPTPYQYLMLGNIQDGIIDKELPYLKELDKKQMKYCVKNHDLVMSKNGNPFKIAVAEVEDEIQILANGNLYIIELDNTLADAYYIKAFLESEVGEAELKKIVVGAVIPSIGLEQLKNIQVPVPPLEEQKRVAEGYRAVIDEVRVLRKKVNEATRRMDHFFDENT